MLATVLYRLAGETEVDYAMPFTDVAEGEWYTEAIRWAASEGIVTGITETTFEPNTMITREQFATMLYRYEQMNGGGFEGAWAFLLEQEDAADISDWAFEAMSYMIMRGVITGRTDGMLDPQGVSTRAEVATMLMRYTMLDTETDASDSDATETE